MPKSGYCILWLLYFQVRAFFWLCHFPVLKKPMVIAFSPVGIGFGIRTREKQLKCEHVYQATLIKLYDDLKVKLNSPAAAAFFTELIGCNLFTRWHLRRRFHPMT
jgi:hypothetical protein